MSKIYQLIIHTLLLCFLLSACVEKLSPEQEEQKEKNEIIKDAPINLEYKINPPAEGASPQIKEFSGRWVGKWNKVIPSQLVVTDINQDKVTFIYSWGKMPTRDIEAGSIKKTVKLNSGNKIEFEQEEVITSFVINTILHKIIGAQIDGNEVSNIVMEKVE